MIGNVKFALNNDVHAFTGYTLFYMNGITPCVSLKPQLRGSELGGGVADWLAVVIPSTFHKAQGEFLAAQINVLRHTRDALAYI